MAGINRAAELARTGSLPVVEVDEGYYTRSDLEVHRGWNHYLIRKFLKPDRIRKVMGVWEDRDKNWAKERRVRYYEFEYCETQVAAIEATPEWQKAKTRSDRKAAQGRVNILQATKRT